MRTLAAEGVDALAVFALDGSDLSAFLFPTVPLMNPPEWDEFKASLREMIIAGRRLVATRAHGRGTNSRPDANFDGFLVGGKSIVVVNESPKTVAVV